MADVSDRQLRAMTYRIKRARFHLDDLESQLQELKELPKKRFVQVAFFNDVSVESEKWDYIDGIGNLRPGDRVVARTVYGVRNGIVVGTSQRPTWHGPYTSITERMP